MTFRIPASAAQKPENQFVFESADGQKTYHVPFLQYLPPKLIIEIGDADDDDKLTKAMSTILQYYSTEDMDLVGLFEDGTQLRAWMDAWQEASTASLGESEASVESSESTEAR